MILHSRHIGFGVIALLLAACTTPKDITYMQGFEAGDTEAVRVPHRLTVEPDDRLSIVVSSQYPELAEVFNLAIAQTRIGLSSKNTYSSDSRIATFHVDQYGEIDYPLIGKIKIAGLTRSEVAAKVKKAILDAGLLKDPVVTVDFMNATVSILGDVNSPGEYSIDRDDLTVLQAIGKAGDLAITGMRKNVLVVRHENGKATSYRIDLTNTADILQSPVYYVQQNDVIYVEPNSTKKRLATANANNAMTTSFWISVISVLTSVAILIFK